MALLISEIACDIREVTLREKPVAMIKASAKATVPVLVVSDSHVIDESIDIMRWALGQNDPEHWLDGDDAALIAANDGAFKHHLDGYKYPERHDGAPIEHRANGLALLADFDARIAANDGQLCRPTRALADIALMPFVRQFAATDKFWFDAQPLPALHRWLAGHLASDLFVSAMVRLPVWSAPASEPQ